MNETTTVRSAFYQFMRDCGVRTIFGNPGSTELPLFRDFPPDFDYVLGLQEAAVVAMADGFAQGTDNAAFVNLHSAAGVGNAMGNIYTAFKNQTPMVLVAGQQARSIQAFDPYLHSKQAAELPRPYVKWSIEPARAEDVPLAVARAYHVAMQQPRGPVLVSVPSDDWHVECSPVERRDVTTRSRPDAEAIAALARSIDGAGRIALVVGAGVDRDGAWPQLLSLAERCSAGVFVAPLSSRCGFPEDHALFQGFLAGNAAQIKPALAGHDLVLVVGAPAFTYHVERDAEGSHLPPGARLAVLHDDPEVLAMASEGQGVLGNIRLVLDDLLERISPEGPVRTAPSPRVRAPRVPADGPLDTAFVLQTLADLRRPEDIVVEEAPTARIVMHQHLPITRPRTFFTMASGGLGFGMPAAVGLGLAQPGRRVVCVVGDGSSMYSIQALWTAAQRGVDVTFVVLNNGLYAAMKRFARLLGFRADEKVVGIDIAGIDFALLARAQGCAGERVSEPAALEGAVRRAFERRGPSLIDVVVP